MEPKLTFSHILSLFIILFLQGARAEDTSGAVVWWMLFVLVCLIVTTAFLFYRVYHQEKPYGKGHVFSDVVDDERADIYTTNRQRSSRYAAQDNPNMAGDNGNQDRMQRSSAAPPSPKLSKQEGEVMQLMKVVKGEDEPMKDGEFMIYLDAYNPQDMDFIEKAKKTKFPNYNMLYIFNIDVFMENKGKEMIDFLHKSTPKQIKYFALHSKSYYDITPIMKTVKLICNSTVLQVYFEQLYFNTQTFAQVIEMCAHVDELIFHDCKIQIDDEFKLNPKTKFRIKALDLYGSLKQESDDYLSSETFPKVLRAINETKLADTIETIHIIDDNDFYPPKSVNSMFQIYGYKFKLLADNNKPDWKN